jgi:SWI/SNF-related matrix-associated actin-dependent regulator 1 of chromatin subfamily A
MSEDEANVAVFDFDTDEQRLELESKLRLHCGLAQYPETLDEVLSRGIEYHLGQRAQQANNESKEDDGPVVPGLSATLYPHQLEALKFVQERERCLLALDMGLGKTLTSIASILLLPDPTATVLVICPATLRDNWKAELDKFVEPGLVTPIIIKNTKHGEKILASPPPADQGKTVFIISYALLSRVAAMIAKKKNKIKFHLVVADECHYLKNSKSKRAKATLKIIRKKVDKLILLTGTPSQRNESLWNLLRLMQPVMFKSFHHGKPLKGFQARMLVPSTDIFHFADRYCDTEIIRVSGNRHAYSYKKSKRAKELRWIIAPDVLRQTKHLLSLPPILTETVTIGETSKRQTTHFDAKMRQVEKLRKERGTLAANSLLSELVRETSRVKLPHVLAYLTEMFDNIDDDEPVILWNIHVFFGDALAAHMEELGIGHIRIDGNVNVKSRDGLLDKFRQDPGCRVAILSLGSCNAGLTLTNARVNVYCENSWNGIATAQSESRTHRIGQKRTVLIMRLVLKGTLDTLVTKCTERKRKLEASVMGDAPKKISDEHEEKEGPQSNHKKKRRRVEQIEL